MENKNFKITAHVLSLPPYLSTSWNNVTSLQVQWIDSTPLLLVHLRSDVIVEIPDLEEYAIHLIFAEHAKYLENEESGEAKKLPLLSAKEMELFSFPLKIGGDSAEGVLVHNPSAKNSPDLPKELLNRIALLSRMLGKEGLQTFPKPEPHCNCFYCQIVRAMHQMEDELIEEKNEELVSDDDLKFRLWDIQPTGDKLYRVTSSLDLEEHYDVFLGDPVGCTCGNPHCEHIRAVLNS